MGKPLTAARSGGPALRRASRFSIDRFLDPRDGSTLADDVRAGLTRRQKQIPSKYFYDERGSRLFEKICDLPEYYLTRTEQTLLDRHAREILAIARPTDLVELGSGAAKKTRALLDAAAAEGLSPRYHPFDVCEPVLRSSGERLLDAYPWLDVHAIVADYDRHLDGLPPGRRRMVAFLGSTIGNYTPERTVTFLAELAAELRPGELFLLGADLVKPVERLEAAYDDSAGVTAEFNRNVLRVVNRELDGDFRPEEFEHLAFFDRERSQIEMHLRAGNAQRVRIAELDLEVELRAGETIHTEISRKFTEAGLRDLFGETGFRVRGWYAPADDAFVLLLAERV
ncbi:MAG: L-histidine N(alpha)-methyltransferase [Candidatus Binatia bacterium]